MNLEKIIIIVVDLVGEGKVIRRIGSCRYKWLFGLSVEIDIYILTGTGTNGMVDIMCCASATKYKRSLRSVCNPLSFFLYSVRNKF